MPILDRQTFAQHSMRLIIAGCMILLLPIFWSAERLRKWKVLQRSCRAEVSPKSVLCYTVKRSSAVVQQQYMCTSSRLDDILFVVFTAVPRLVVQTCL